MVKPLPGGLCVYHCVCPEASPFSRSAEPLSRQEPRLLRLRAGMLSNGRGVTGLKIGQAGMSPQKLWSESDRGSQGIQEDMTTKQVRSEGLRSCLG